MEADKVREKAKGRRDVDGRGRSEGGGVRGGRE